MSEHNSVLTAAVSVVTDVSRKRLDRAGNRVCVSARTMRLLREAIERERPELLEFGYRIAAGESYEEAISKR